MTRTGSFWPSRTQELLLRTALAEPEAGISAWNELQPGFALQELELGAFAVLPLVYRAVARARAEDPLLPRLKGMYRSTWVKNNLLSERLAEAVDGLEAAGVEVLLIGSLPAAVRYYPELALRPTPALEFLIAPEEFVPASRALGRLGFAARGQPRLGRVDPVALYDAQGHACLLRAAPAVDLVQDRDLIRAASVPVQVGRTLVRALAPTDDLLVACVSGARVRPSRSVQWLIDMAQILRTVPAEVDWQRLVTLAAARGQTPRLGESLAYVHGTIGVPVPSAATDALDALPMSVRDRIAYACAGSSVRALGTLPQALGEHLVASRRRPPWAALAAFPGFLRRRWEVDHGWQLPLAGGRRAYGALIGGGERQEVLPGGQEREA